jgi:biotin-[acetyl-CoA-carboxylase] ligase BirA-like protein
MAHAEDELLRELGATSPLGRQWVVSWHKSIPTTMEAAKDLVPSVDENHPGLCVTEIQSSGRGTRGRTWVGVEEGFYGTFVFDAPEDRISAEKLPAFSLVAGLIVAEVLTEIGCQARVKWVNDVLSAEGKKISGNLLELVRTGGKQVVLIGVGVNLRGSPDPDKATSVYDLLGRSVTRLTMASWLANRLADSFTEFLERGFAPFRVRWESVAAFMGKPITVEIGEERLAGILVGVDVEGRLRLQLPSGERIIHTGRVTPL